MQSPLQGPNGLAPVSSPSGLKSVPPTGVAASTSFAFTAIFLVLASSLGPESGFGYTSPLGC